MSKPLKISDNITFESIDENVYILNIDNGEYYKLSKSASLIWREIDAGSDIDEIKIKLKSKFSNNDDIENDVKEVIRDLINLNLIADNWEIFLIKQ